MQRWGGWAAECFSKKADQLTPKIVHIQELKWGEEEMRIDGDLQLIRQKAALTKIIQEEPDTETWRYQEYGARDIDRKLRILASRKAHGRGGIPGEEYKETRTWAIKS